MYRLDCGSFKDEKVRVSVKEDEVNNYMELSEGCPINIVATVYGFQVETTDGKRVGSLASYELDRFAPCVLRGLTRTENVKLSTYNIYRKDGKLRKNPIITVDFDILPPKELEEKFVEPTAEFLEQKVFKSFENVKLKAPTNSDYWNIEKINIGDELDIIEKYGNFKAYIKDTDKCIGTVNVASINSLAFYAKKGHAKAVNGKVTALDIYMKNGVDLKASPKIEISMDIVSADEY